MLVSDIYDNYYGPGMNKQTKAIGIEFEVEAQLPLPRAPAGWVEHAEGSLRNGGKEYVTDGTIDIDDTFSTKLSAVLDPINRCRPIEDSPRTSVHVHRNVLQYSPAQVYAIACVYWLLENLLFKYCGKEREGNHFCLRLSDSEGLIRTLTQDIRSNLPFFTHLHADNVKYAGLNLATVQRFGSIEFRGMRGVYRQDIVERWCRELDSMVNAAAKLRTPDAVLDYYFRSTREDFLSTFFSKAFCEELKALDPDWSRTIDKNSGLISGLAYLHDWDKWEARIKKNISGGEVPKRTNRIRVNLEEALWGEIPRAILRDNAPPPIAVENIEDDLDA